MRMIEMDESPSPVAITISRQLGSGASFIGHLLARRLGIVCLNREVLYQAAWQLYMPEESPRICDAVAEYWGMFARGAANDARETIYASPPLSRASDHEVFDVESRIIQHAAKTQSVVVVGRGGVHILRDHPRRISIYLHAAYPFRVRRVQELYQLSERDAAAVIETADRERTYLHHRIAKKALNDANYYDLCLDTSTLGVMTTLEFIEYFVSARLAAMPA